MAARRPSQPGARVTRQIDSRWCSPLRRRRLLLMPAGSLAGREAAESAGRAFGPPGRRRGSSGEYPKGGAVRMLPLSRFMSFGRSEEHTSELQSLMRISYAVFCLKKKKKNHNITTELRHTHLALLMTQ